MDAITRAPGRPRSEATRTAILEAAFAVLVERGYGAMSIEAVAAAAGAGKSTVYRWWRTKADLALDSFFAATPEAPHRPETGSARDDFRSDILELADLLRGRRGRALAEMLGGARTDRDLARALAERWIEPRRRWGLARLKRAATSGECRPGIDNQAALNILYGPLYAPLLFGQGLPSKAQIEAHLAIAFAGLFRWRAEGGPGPARPRE